MENYSEVEQMQRVMSETAKYRPTLPEDSTYGRNGYTG